MDEPDAIACHVVALSCDGRTFGNPFGVYALACVVTGGSGEAPQPPATFGNRFAIGETRRARCATPEGFPMDEPDAIGCHVVALSCVMDAPSETPSGFMRSRASSPGVAAKRRNPRLRSEIASRLGIRARSGPT
jgi:hypothetical protein